MLTKYRYFAASEKSAVIKYERYKKHSELQINEESLAELEVVDTSTDMYKISGRFRDFQYMHEDGYIAKWYDGVLAKQIGDEPHQESLMDAMGLFEE